jgi:hypothetical protein
MSPKVGTDVVVLDEEEDYVFEADGKAIHTHYLVYKVLTQKGADGWDTRMGTLARRAPHDASAGGHSG